VRPLVSSRNQKCEDFGFDRSRRSQEGGGKNSECCLPHAYLRRHHIGKRTRACGTADADTAEVTTSRLAAAELIIIPISLRVFAKRRRPLSRKSAGASDFLLLYLTRTLQFFFFYYLLSQLALTLGLFGSAISVVFRHTRLYKIDDPTVAAASVCVCVAQSAQQPPPLRPRVKYII
jgi:hypothetical protein